MVLKRLIIGLLLLNNIQADEDAVEIEDDEVKEVKTVLDGKTPCTIQAQCGDDGFFYCNEETKVCVHKELFPMLP